MDYETTLKFVEAGYTADEIRALENGDGAEVKTESDAEKPNAETNEANAEHESKVIKRETDPNNEIEELKKTVAELNETIKALQSANIANANGGKKPIDSVKEAIDSFINEF